MTNKTEFYGTRQELERLRVRAHAVVKWLSPVTIQTRIYVDGAGTIYAANPESGRMTRIAGHCIPKEAK